MYSREEVQKFLAERVARPSSAGVLLENAAGEVLVVKANYKDYWTFPGGWVEHGQTPRDAAVRELAEEVGIDRAVDDLKLLCVVDRKSDIMQTYQFIFRAETLYGDDTVTLQPEEIDEYRFVSKDEVLGNVAMYNKAVEVWARGDTSGYFEQEL